MHLVEASESKLEAKIGKDGVKRILPYLNAIKRSSVASTSSSYGDYAPKQVKYYDSLLHDASNVDKLVSLSQSIRDFYDILSNHEGIASLENFEGFFEYCATEEYNFDFNELEVFLKRRFIPFMEILVFACGQGEEYTY